MPPIWERPDLAPLLDALRARRAARLQYARAILDTGPEVAPADALAALRAAVADHTRAIHAALDALEEAL